MASTNRLILNLLAFAGIALAGTAVTNRAMAAPVSGQKPDPADLVLTNARIYTATGVRESAHAMAIRQGRIVFVGSQRDAQRWVGPGTVVRHMNGKRILPGLIDAHLHAMDIVDLDVCDLRSEPHTLREITDIVRTCLTKYQTPTGGRLVVHQWNYTTGNQPDADHPTLRAALDAASTEVQIELLGNDGHHGAFNSLALSQARGPDGTVIGLSKATLAGQFAAFRKIVGVDAHGEPNGAVNEDARLAIDPHAMLNTDLAEVAKAPERVAQRLNSVGITAIMDAMVTPDALPVYDAMQARGGMTMRTVLALFYDPEHFRRADGHVDYDAMVAAARKVREKYAHNPLIKADTVKLFADGVMEGNPLATPPTLPNAAVLRNYLQPLFKLDPKGMPTVTGYVDTASPLCVQERIDATRYEDPAAAAAFMREHGFLPAQCQISDGQLQHSREVILEFARRFHLAGFNLHIHVIGDRAVRTAVDAIELARAADGNTRTRDGLAHIQLADPSDVARIGRDHLYVAFTYAWMTTGTGYDMTVIPFLEKVIGNSYAALHPPQGLYEKNAYPVRAVKKAGGIVAAGSDAPVDTRDPRPFVNIATAVTRSADNAPPLNPSQRLGILEAIDAYTINGARMLGLDKETGSIQAGKSADFIILDRDIIRLANRGKPADIAGTRVLETWFQGRQVYAAK